MIPKWISSFTNYTDSKDCLYFDFFSVSGKLYAIGGRYQHKHSDDVEEYDPVSILNTLLSNKIIFSDCIVV